MSDNTCTRCGKPTEEPSLAICVECLADEHSDQDEAAKATPLGALTHHYMVNIELFCWTAALQSTPESMERHRASASRRLARSEKAFREIAGLPEVVDLPGWAEYLLDTTQKEQSE